MWHLKTKLGTFWIVEAKNNTNANYFLGINEQELGTYDNPEQASHDVHDQETGYLKWDTLAQISTPDSISEWEQGEPDNW